MKRRWVPFYICAIKLCPTSPIMIASYLSSNPRTMSHLCLCICSDFRGQTQEHEHGMMKYGLEGHRRKE